MSHYANGLYNISFLCYGEKYFKLIISKNRILGLKVKSGNLVKFGNPRYIFPICLVFRIFGLTLLYKSLWLLLSFLGLWYFCERFNTTVKKNIKVDGFYYPF